MKVEPAHLAFESHTARLVLGTFFAIVFVVSISLVSLERNRQNAEAAVERARLEAEAAVERAKQENERIRLEIELEKIRPRKVWEQKEGEKSK